MIEHELILLGLLKESPQHGYEIKRKIREILSLFAGIDFKSIYYPLRMLETKGFLSKRVAKHGHRPERFVYYLTPQGKVQFEKLLMKSFLDFTRPQFSLDLSLYFLDYMLPAVARRRLRARMQLLKRLSKNLTPLVSTLRKKKSRSLARIVEHNLQMVQAESRFLNYLIETL
jgi:DNA-binding PadR family transcriptional regulator